MLTLLSVGRDYVIINHPIVSMQKLYGVELNSPTEVINYPPSKKVEEIYFNLREKGISNPNQYLFLVILKDKIAEKFIYDPQSEEAIDLFKTKIFAFAFDKEILNHFPNSSWKKLESYELANALLQVHTLSSGVILNGFEEIEELKPFQKRKGAEKFIYKVKDLYNLYASLTPEERLYSLYAEPLLNQNKQARVYVSSGITSEEIKWEEVLKTPFEGALWIILSFNPVDSFIEKLRNAPYRESAEFFNYLKEEYKKGLPLLLNQAVLISKREVSKETLHKLFSAIGFIPWETFKYRDIYLEETPIKFVYEPYMHLAFADRLKYVFISGLKKTTTPTKKIKERQVIYRPPQIYGLDKFSSVVQYSNFDYLKEKVNNPHIAFVAESGTGKSFSIQQFTANILDLSPQKIEKLFKGEKFNIDEYRTDVKIRYFDKGYSAYKFFKLLELRGFDVSIFAVSPDDVYFNPLEFGLEFATEFTNLLLEILRVDKLSGEERKFFEKAYKILFKQENLWISKTEKLKYLTEHFDGFKKYLVEKFGKKILKEKVISLNYHLKTETFNYPIYSDLLRVIVNESEKEKYTSEEKKIWKSLQRKINLLIETQFNAWTKIDLKSARLFYMDIEGLVNWQFFPALMLGVLRILFEEDKMQSAQNPALSTYYVFDEVQNLLEAENKRIEAVSRVLEILLREARKYRISVMLATQNWGVFPEAILINLATRILVAGGEADRKKAIKMMERLPHIFGKVEDYKDIIITAPFRSLIVFYPFGVFTFKFPLTPVLKSLFSSYEKILTTPDGLTIKTP